jgi:ABC-2 type transport system ATP-binding protein
VFDYPGHRALDDVSFRIESKSITALVGPNGAGKSTLLRCCAALDRPFAGIVELDGYDIHEKPRLAHRRMGFLPDFYGLYDELTVRQCLTYRAAAVGLPRGQWPERVRLAAERMEIMDRLGDKAGALSRGQRQRLAIAQAIIHEPALLLLDEPASGLDPEARMGLSAVLRALRDKGMTIIVSSHILAELEDYSTHMLVIREGRILHHRALDPLSKQRVRIRVEVAGGEHKLVDVLSHEGGVTELTLIGSACTFEYPASAVSRHTLLKHLMNADLHVVEFKIDEAGLQEAYLEQVRAAEAARGLPQGIRPEGIKPPGTKPPGIKPGPIRP